jgi:hypothetical protein
MIAKKRLRYLMSSILRKFSNSVALRENSQICCTTNSSTSTELTACTIEHSVKLAAEIDDLKIRRLRTNVLRLELGNTT